ncbi:MAG: GntR family transcriptional regulator [Streptosporangiales bacterium]|nr:GntR family transcriptional regulator [Streptosporangiales bacterium]
MARLNKTQTRAEQIARQIQMDIEAGKLRHGQALPSGRAYAKEWGTSPGTMASALKLLEENGLVVSRPRSGRTVNAPGQAARPDRPPVPQVILIGGYAGSGKTELGRIIARSTGWAMLDKDTITRAVVEAALEMLGESPYDREGEVYLGTVRPAEYQALLDAMSENIDVGTSTVVTAPFVREFADRAWLDRTIALCQSKGAQVTVVWIRCDADSMKTYLRHRGAARDAYKLSHWDEYLAGVDLEFTPAGEHRLVRNSAGSPPLQDQAAEILRHVTQDISRD